MNQKFIIAILGITVIILIGTTVYFATISKAGQSVVPAPKVVEQQTPTPAPAPAAKPVQPAPANEATNLSTYTNSQYGYALSYPKTNVVTSLDKDNDRLYVSHVKIGDDILIRVLSKANLGTIPTSCAAEKTLTEQVKCEYLVLENNANRITQQKFGENNFVYADFESVDHPDVKIRTIWAFVANNDYIYQLEVLNPDSAKETSFKKIISTFKLLN